MIFDKDGKLTNGFLIVWIAIALVIVLFGFGPMLWEMFTL